LLVTGCGVVAAFAAHRFLGAIGPLTWAVLLGALAANVNLIPPAARSGMATSMKAFLRTGIVLLGFSLPLAAIIALGLPVIAVVLVTLLSTLLGTWWLGLRMGVGRARSLLIATGFAICGASAIVAMEDNADGDESDVTTAIAMVTICGSVLMLLLPLLQVPLALDDTEFGMWAGASVHEVGQVVAAAGPAGATAVSVAVVVKLTRVLLLAPVVAGVSVLRRRSSVAGSDRAGSTKLPPLVPLFVLGFLACVLIRSTGWLDAQVLTQLERVQTVALSAGLFGLGAAVHLPSLMRSSIRPLVLSVISTLVVAVVSLGSVMAIHG